MVQRRKARLVIKRIPNIFAYIETRSREVTVPSIGKEQVSTVAKPELKAVVIISGIFSFFINTGFCTREIQVKNNQNRIDNGKIRVATKLLVYTLFYSN
jgi:hypothetical protein